ncbi:MAG TPA: hypothetical protein GX692_06305 [Acholeplasmataceae bacterium]|nr:hypothetical protein [Acholeplasmataceae bacterium]
MEKPVSLVMEEAKQNYVEAINEITKKHNLPMYFVEIIIGAIYNEINNLKQIELKQTKMDYEKVEEEKERKEGSFFNGKEK